MPTAFYETQDCLIAGWVSNIPDTWVCMFENKKMQTWGRYKELTAERVGELYDYFNIDFFRIDQLGDGGGSRITISSNGLYFDKLFEYTKDKTIYITSLRDGSKIRSRGYSIKTFYDLRVLAAAEDSEGLGSEHSCNDHILYIDCYDLAKNDNDNPH